MAVVVDSQGPDKMVLPAVAVALALTAVPVFAVLFGVILGVAGAPGTLEIVGGLCIIAGIAIIRWTYLCCLLFNLFTP